MKILSGIAQQQAKFLAMMEIMTTQKTLEIGAKMSIICKCGKPFVASEDWGDYDDACEWACDGSCEESQPIQNLFIVSDRKKAMLQDERYN
jgi:hypothetical protein